MRAIVQRVCSASVHVDDVMRASIGYGLLVYVGISVDDQINDHVDDAAYLANKICTLRIFEDDAKRMNRDVLETHNSVMAVSAFTLMGDARRGRRPSFTNAARDDHARSLYDAFCHVFSERGIMIEPGVYGANMKIHSVNDGPVCMLIDSKKIF